MSPSPIEQERAPRAVVTNGEGSRCTSHLNLTVSLGALQQQHSRNRDARARLGLAMGRPNLISRAAIPAGTERQAPEYEKPAETAPAIEVGIRRSSVDRIMREVCLKHNVRKLDLISERRAKELVAARHEAMWRMRNETTMSLPAIGRRLGGRDHSTVISGINAHERRMRKAAANG